MRRLEPVWKQRETSDGWFVSFGRGRWRFAPPKSPKSVSEGSTLAVRAESFVRATVAVCSVKYPIHSKRPPSDA